MSTLTSVTLASRAEPRLAAHSDRISAFLDGSVRFSRDQAVATGSAVLVQRVLTRLFTVEEPLALNRWVWTTLQTTIAAKSGHAMVQCLVKFVHASRSLWDVAVWAVYAKDLTVLQWVYDEATKKDGICNQDLLLREAVLSCELEIVQWVVHKRQTEPATTPTFPAKLRKKTKAIDLGAIAKGTAFASEKTMTDAKWDIVEFVLETLGVVLHRSLPTIAAKQGRLQTIQKIKQCASSTLGSSVCNAAAANGHFEIVALLGGKPTDEAMDDAAMVGNLEVMKTLQAEFGCDVTAVGVIRAADQGHTHVLKWLYETFPHKAFWKDLQELLTPALWAAIESDKLPTVEWLYETLLVPVFEADEKIDRRIVGTIQVYSTIRFQQLPLMQYVHSKGLVNWDDWESHNAAYYANLPMLLWLKENGLMGEPYHELQSAVYGGRMECVQWILENRPRGTSNFALEAAANARRLDLLELLVAKGYTGSFRCMDYAATNGFMDVVQFLYEHRREDGVSQAAIHGAAMHGHVDVVKFLTEHPVQGAVCSTTAMDSAASKNHLEMVEYLHFNRTEGCSEFAMDAAAANGNLAIVQFLHTHRTEGCTEAALENAAVNVHFDVVKFLVTNYPHKFSTKAAVRARAKGEVEIALWLEQSSGAVATTRAKRRSSSRSGSVSAVAMPPASPVVVSGF